MYLSPIERNLEMKQVLADFVELIEDYTETR